MYDTLVKSTIFGFRNADKVVNTDDKGRIFADIGQFTNAARAAAQLDNVVGKGAQAALDAMGHVTEKSKVLGYAKKGASWASKNVNPLLIGAAGYRVLVADDKETALKREIFGMTSMFGAEAAMKQFFKANSYQAFVNKIPNSKVNALVKVAEGVLFVMGSIAGSTLGYKLGELFFPGKKEKAEKLNNNTQKLNEIAATSLNRTNNQNNEDIDNIDDSEYFAVSGQEKTLA